MASEFSANSVVTTLAHLFHRLSRRRRFQLIALIGLTLVSSLAEVTSLGTVVPFIGILTQPDKVLQYPVVAEIVQVFNIKAPYGVVLLLAIAFSIATLFSGGMRLLLSWVNIRLANAIGADFSIEIYRKTLYQPYRVHVARNSSEVISIITQKVGAVTGILLSLVTLITSTSLFLAILITLLVINPMVASIAVICFGTCYGIITWKSRRRLLRNSACISKEQTLVIKSLQEGLGGIRDVILDGTQSVYSEIYRKAVHRLMRAISENSFIGQAPRFIMEPLGIVLIVTLATILGSRGDSLGGALAILGALAFGAQRMLPLLQQIYMGWSTTMGSYSQLVDAVDLLNQPLPQEATHGLPDPFQLRDAIQIKNVWFRYNDNGPWVLNGINLTIKIGQRIGFMGTTGSGKSTALDLLMALLEPTKGHVYIDGRSITDTTLFRRSWQRSIAHVPQSIFLADTSIAENIAFGVPREQIDLDRVKQAAKQAQISEFIQSLPEGYSTLVGERGIRLSGGQRQRIGIARALYKQATILVFDEATSALDNATEETVMNAIENLSQNLTVLIVAHRLTTLRYCDTIIQLEHGKMVEQGSYEHFMNTHSGILNWMQTTGTFRG